MLTMRASMRSRLPTIGVHWPLAHTQSQTSDAASVNIFGPGASTKETRSFPTGPDPFVLNGCVCTMQLFGDCSKHREYVLSLASAVYFTGTCRRLPAII